MTRSNLLLFIGGLALAGCGRSHQPGAASGEDRGIALRHEGVTALVGAVLIDGDGSPARAGTVVIRDGRIECAGECAVSDNMQVVDVTGRYIIPGLVDAHMHYSQTGWADGRPDAED